MDFNAHMTGSIRPTFKAQFGVFGLSSSFAPIPPPTGVGSFQEKVDLFVPAPGQTAFVLTAQVSPLAIIKIFVNGNLCTEDFSLSGSGTVTISFIGVGYTLSTTDLIRVIYS